MGTLALGDADQIKLILNITDTSRDAELTVINTQISAIVDQFVFGENVVGFRTVPSGPDPTPDLVELHDGGLDAIVTRRYISDDPDTRDLVVVIEDGVTLVQGTDYHIPAHPSRTIYRTAAADNFRAVFAPGMRNVQATYTAESTVAPADIAGIVESETARAFLMRNNNSTDGGGLVLSARSPEAGDSITYRLNDFSPLSMRVLTTHKNGQRYF